MVQLALGARSRSLDVFLLDPVVQSYCGSDSGTGTKKGMAACGFHS